MTVLVTVRVLPFFLTFTFTRSGTLMVSTFGARSYTDHKYRSMQISVTTHSSVISMELAARSAGPCAGAGVLPDASCMGGISRRDIGSRAGKAASGISIMETASIAVGPGASMGLALAVALMIRLPARGAGVSVRGE